MGRFIKTAVGTLIAANASMFVVFHLIVALCGTSAAQWFGLTAPLPWPWLWTPLTYMFTETSLWNLLFDLLWIYFFGQVFMEIGNGRQLLTAYFAGGIAGACVYAAATACGAGGGGLLFGSSAAALGVITCAAMRVPRMRFTLLFFGAVELRWIAAVAVGLSLLSFASGNAGGGFAHIGGAAGGIAAALIIRRQMRFRIVMPKPRKPAGEKTLDELLDKVKRSGYSSLNADERRQLLDYSRKL